MLVPAGTQRWPGKTWTWRARYDCSLGGRRWRGRRGVRPARRRRKKRSGGKAGEEEKEEGRRKRSGGKGGEEVAGGSV